MQFPAKIEHYSVTAGAIEGHIKGILDRLQDIENFANEPDKVKIYADVARFSATKILEINTDSWLKYFYLNFPDFCKPQS